MWLAPIVVLLLILALIGAVIGGGIFTLVLVPIAILVGLSALGYAMWNRASAPGLTAQGTSTSDPLPHSHHLNTAPTPSTPDALVDAQQKQQ